MKKLWLLTLTIILATGILYSQDRPVGKTFATRSETIARHGMAATSQPLATQTALAILKKGGNAVDAAIAANAVLGLTEPTGSGIGGDLFAMVWIARDQKLYGLNASGRSPLSLSMEYFRKHNISHIPPYGPLPVTVPGCVDGWFELHGKFGKISMKEILNPAIQYAREGFPVSEVIANSWQENVDVLKDYPNFSEIFTINGHAPRKGEIFKNPCLANTLEKIAEGGRDVFYKGDVARVIAEFMKKMNGFLTYRDLASHHSQWVEPVSTNYRGFDIWELPPNSQGIAVLQMLNILEGYDLKSMRYGSADYLHLLIEAKKLAYEDRARYYADPDFQKIPLDILISKEYAAKRRALIDPDTAAKFYEAGDLSLEKGETVYLTVADEEGNMVSLIQSNYQGMGSGMVPDELGFVLQDRGELFSLQDGHPNMYEPGKRPFHTIIPGFVTQDGEALLSFGVMGGSMQPQGHVQVLINMIDFGMNLQEAGDAPRIRHSGSSQPYGGVMTDGGWVNMESGFDYETIRELERRGHRIRFQTGGYGGYQAIMRDQENRVYYGASESRKDGQAAGY
jgi:gamma-glutamyltranspeptidase/glutathione hydrolase